MAIEWKVLGRAGADNALHVIVDSGQARESLIFDCGERCLDELRPSTVQSVAHLCFSHFHMDHVAGFDGFFRLNYNRPDIPVAVWGPPGTIAVMEHRFQGFVWNLHSDQAGEWIVRQIDPERISGARFLTREAFTPAHRQPDRPWEAPVIHRAGEWRLEACLLPHGSIESVAYRVVESARRNIDPAALRRHGHLPGPWLREVANETTADDEFVEVAGRALRVGELRRELLVSTPGASIAWLTDFRVEPGGEAWERLVAWLHGTDTLVCECQYRSADHALAIANAHMTADLVGRLAAEANAGRLVLQHLSRRYTAAEWLAMRDEAAVAFPRTELPPEWNLRG